MQSFAPQLGPFDRSAEKMEVAHAASIRVSVRDVPSSCREISQGHPGMPPRPSEGGREGGKKESGRASE